MMGYQVAIRLAGESWTLTDNGRGEATDGVRVLAGLDFGWSLPGGIWPQQPQPMGASLAVNVPDFAAFEVAEGDVCTVEVKADEDGPIVARFYGDVTDYHASPRPGRPGVTLDVTAVDYTVRTAEIETAVIPVDALPLDLYFVNAIWLAAGLGPDVDDLWTSPNRSLTDDIPNFIERISIRGVLDRLLLQAVDTAGHRMILSPLVDPDTGLVTAGPSGRTFTLDSINNELAGVVPVEIPASAVRRDQVDWANVKGQTLGRIVVTGWGGDSANATSAAFAGATVDTYAALTTTFVYEADAIDLAEFYATVGFQPWQLDKVTIPVTRADAADLVPADLFPDWTSDESETARTACYRQLISITDVDPTRTPDGSDTITGLLTGARCRINGGQLELDLALRRPNT